MKTHLYLIHALSPLHAGTGQAVGAIDLPIAREKPTGIPIVPGSSIKGALRARCENNDDTKASTATVFGTKTGADNESAGAVQFSDAHLLLLPVRSIAGTFAWVTSPFLIQRFARDAKEAGKPITVPKQPKDIGHCFTAKDPKIVTTGRVLLEDFDFQRSQDEQAIVDELADILASILFPGDDEKEWRATLKERLCIVHDDVMALLLETATEVVARIKLEEDTKTVSKGALWYEEALPTESVLYGLAAASDVKAKEGTLRQAKNADELLREVAKIAKGMVQLGGKATVGRGVCHVRLHGGAS